jgi:hypothetical protein
MSSTGARWARLIAIVQYYATLQWSVVQERVSRKKKQSSGESTKVAKKCKASESKASGSRRSSKAKTGAGASVAPLSDELKKRGLQLKLCHKCHQPGHQAKHCPLNKKKRGKVAAASGNAPQNGESSEEDF